MNNILLFLDTETTGLSLAKAEIIQIAAIAVYNGEWAGTINLSCQPFSYDNIDLEALGVCNIPLSTLKTFDLPVSAFNKFVTGLTKIRNRISPDIKFKVIAHNAPFDKKFLQKWWKNCSDNADVKFPLLSNYLEDEWIDSVVIARELLQKNIINSDGAKLENLASYYSVEYDGRGAHDALSDTKVLQQVFGKLIDDCERSINNGVDFKYKYISEVVSV